MPGSEEFTDFVDSRIALRMIFRRPLADAMLLDLGTTAAAMVDDGWLCGKKWRQWQCDVPHAVSGAATKRVDDGQANSVLLTEFVWPSSVVPSQFQYHRVIHAYSPPHTPTRQILRTI